MAWVAISVSISVNIKVFTSRHAELDLALIVVNVVGAAVVIYTQIVRFADTDAAGVVYFARLLEFCHAAYEAALAEVGVDAPRFFGGDPELAVPITQVSADFWRPLRCGDRVQITLQPTLVNESQFTLAYTVFLSNAVVATAQTTHVAIHPPSRKRYPLPLWLRRWVEEFVAEAIA